MSDFVVSEPELAARWRDHSGFLVALSVPDEDELYRLSEKLVGVAAGGLWREPDLGYEATGLWLAPSEATARSLESQALPGRHVARRCA